VLIVEDDEDSRQLLATFSNTAERSLPCVTRPNRRSRISPSTGPHVIVSDLSLPGADGLHFIRALRRLEPEAGGDVPAIAVSGYVKDFTAAAAKIAGYSGYLVKPVNLDDLVTLVSRPGESLMTTMRPAALPDLTGLTILVVEDNFDALNLMRAILDTRAPIRCWPRTRVRRATSCAPARPT